MRTLVVYCHPDPESFTAALRSAAVEALSERGHEVRVRDLYGDGFDPRFSADERRTHLRPGSHPSVAAEAEELHWCEHLVLVYPTWWSGQPAMLKGWMDRVWVRGVAWDLHHRNDARVTPRLTNVRRITAITTHGSSKWVNVLEGEGGKRTVTRSLRSMCRRSARTSWIAMYGLDTATPQQRDAFVAKVRRKLSRVSG
jgi:putative NADPH-quinone reductase